jgi:hypothetical protein
VEHFRNKADSWRLVWVVFSELQSQLECAWKHKAQHNYDPRMGKQTSRKKTLKNKLSSLPAKTPVVKLT